MERIYTEIGQRIRTQRRLKDMSQEVLADRISVSRPSVVNIEQGRQRVYLHHLYQIAQVLDIPVNHLLPITVPVHRDFIWL